MSNFAPIMFAGLIVFLLLGFPVAFSLGACGLFFGFVGIFVITQMHGLRWPAWLRWATLAAYLAFMAWVYAGRGLANLNEVIRIPLIEYLLVFILVGLVLLIAKGVEALRPSRAVVATES